MSCVYETREAPMLQQGEDVTKSICEAIRLAHESKRYAKALRKVEQILLRGLGYTTFAEFSRWEGR